MKGFTQRVDNILKKRHIEQRQRRFERCLEETPAGNPVVKDSGHGPKLADVHGEIATKNGGFSAILAFKCRAMKI
jgi:hypothetical protein